MIETSIVEDDCMALIFGALPMVSLTGRATSVLILLGVNFGVLARTLIRGGVKLGNMLRGTRARPQTFKNAIMTVLTIISYCRVTDYPKTPLSTIAV